MESSFGELEPEFAIHGNPKSQQALANHAARNTFAGTSLNPIEQFFARIKHWLRKAAARSVDSVSSSLGEILGRVSAQECANYFKEARCERA